MASRIFFFEQLMFNMYKDAKNWRMPLPALDLWVAHLIIECTIERFSGTNIYRMSIKIEPLRGSFTELSVSTFVPLYNTLVRQHLEYAIQICSPNLFAGSGCLAQVQWLATRLPKGFHRLPLMERLRRPGHHSLKMRLLPDKCVLWRIGRGHLPFFIALF